MVLPFGLKLSNHLPDIKICGFDIELVDLLTGKKYEFGGDKTEITDFILNKGVKVSANGKVKFVDREQFTYKLKIDNKIMPDLDLHELVFNRQEDNNKQKTKTPEIKINILEILKGIYENNITANLDADLTITKDGNSGYIKADNLSIINLPPSITNLKSRGAKIDIDSRMYTAQNESSTL